MPLLEMFIHGGESAGMPHSPLLRSVLAHMPQLKFRYLFVFLLVCISLATVFKNIFVYASELIVSRITRHTEHALRHKIYDRYLTFSKVYFDRNKIGNLCDIATQQVLVAGEAFRFAHNLVFNLFLLSVYFFMMLSISWRLTVPALLFLPLIYIAIKLITKKLEVSTRERFKIDQAMTSYLYNSLANMTLIRSYTTERAEGDSFRKISESSRNNLYSIWKKILFAPHIQDVILMCATSILITLCVFVFLKGNFGALAAFMSFFIILRRFAGNVGGVGTAYTEMSRSFEPINRILMVFDDSDKTFIKSGGTPLSGLNEQIRFENVSFSFSSTSHVLKSVDLTIKKGRCTALVGPTGAGKSTLINMIPRFYDPTSGMVTIDGVNIADLEIKSLRGKIAIVDQDPSILNTTIRNNIAYGSESTVTDARLDEVAQKAYIYDFIQSLPDKYETQTGDKGIRLSGGERQRIAIARALLKDPEIFIFDEATSSLDLETELWIQKAIENVARGRTVILIAHRLSTIRNADQIAFIENGTVKEAGTFKELIDRPGGYFCRYWQLHSGNLK